MKNLNLKKITLFILLALLIIGSGYFIGSNFDAISFAFLHPDKVRIAKHAWETDMKDAEHNFDLRFYVSPLAE